MTPSIQTQWRATLRRRIRAVSIALAVWAVAIEARLVFLQVIRHADLLARAERQHRRTTDAPAERGDILDRHGRVLATSVDADTIYAVPSEIGKPLEAAAALCHALGDCQPKERQALVERLDKARAFAYVRRQVTPEQARRVAALNLDGVGFLKESKRFYPSGQLAASLLGWVGVDNTGLSGLEYTYDHQISGKKGTILILTDARRHAFSRFERPPTSGSSIELTIDEYLQHVAERELRAGVVENRAAGGSAIVMDPHTGEILAMANWPTFDPNAYPEAPEGSRRNRAVQDLYEPGSTFKVVTASAAVEERVMPIDTMIDTNPGQIRIDRSRVVRDVRNHGVLSFTDVIVESSNVGAIKIGFKIGTDRLSQYVQRFGFGRPVSRDFPGENAGIVWRPDKWTDSALASVSMGYQVGVTPLQMAAAVSSVANGGQFVEPRVIRAIYRGNRRLEVPHKVVRRSISADTAAVMTTIMESVVERGTGKPARMLDYTVAGKTGTAEKLINGRYSRTEYNGSFVGFLPSRAPVVTILVVIDSPHGPHGYFGAGVAAPVFKRIAEAAMRYLAVPPTVDPLPPVLVARPDRPGSVADASEPLLAPMPQVTLVAAAPGTVPDVRGLGARDAVHMLSRVGLTPRVSGDGVVTSQTLTPGEAIEPGAVCELRLGRPAIHQPDAVQP